MLRNDRRDKLTAIFKDTVKQYQTIQSLTDSVKKSKSNQQYILQDDKLNVEKKLYEKNKQHAQIVVSTKRSLEAAGSYKNQKVCVHNFASWCNPGGGVVHGSSAQEECLCRCSTLYACLNSSLSWQKFYTPHRESKLNGLHNDDIIYTKNVTVFKSDTDFPEMLDESQFYNVDILTCAAPDLFACQEDGFNVTEQQLADIHECRLRRMLDVALLNNVDVIILGAFGCGAFGNPPNVIANVYKKVITDYKRAFKTIEFAVYCNQKHRQNYEEFAKAFN